MKRLGATLVLVVLACLCGLARATTIDFGTAGRFSYHFASRQFRAGTATKATARCPAGQQLAGSGFGITSPDSVDTYPVNDTMPVDGPDRGREPDDGWRVTGTPVGARSVPSATAICSRVGKFAYKTAHYVMTAADAPGYAIFCPRPHLRVTGGGVALQGQGGGFVNASFPFDGPDAGSAPDDGWAGSVHIDHPGTKKLDIFLICSNAAPTYTSAEHVVDPGEGGLVSAKCPPGQHLSGAGAQLGSVRHRVGTAVRSASGFDSADSDHVPDDGATAFGVLDASAGAPRTLRAYAICVS
jgi:hypothetical protein